MPSKNINLFTVCFPFIDNATIVVTATTNVTTVMIASTATNTDTTGCFRITGQSKLTRNLNR